MSTILVTGSKGTIGQPLVAELSRRGHQVHGCDLSHGTDENCDRFLAHGYYHRCDVSERRQLDNLIRRVHPSFVYHAAAEFGRWNGEDFYEPLWRTNVIGTKNLIQNQEQHRFGLIHFSSSEVYGNDPDLMEEQKALTYPPLNDYAMTKRVNEWQIANSAQDFGTESVIVRLFNTYGPGEKFSPYRSANCRFLWYAMRGQPFRVSDGHQRTSTYIDDAVRTLANIVDRFRPGRTYNIAGIQEHTILTLAMAAIKAMKADPGLVTVSDPEPMTTARKQVSVDRAVAELDHQIAVHLDQGMQRTADWMRSQYSDKT